MRYASVLFFALGAISACDNVPNLDQFTQFDLEYTTSVVIPSSSGINLPFNVFTPSVETDTESTFEVNDTRKELIEQVTLTSLSLSITQPDGSDFSFLESISIFLTADGLDELEVAWYEEVPEGVGSTLVLETTDADLQEYIKKDEFSLRVNTVTDEAILSDHHIDIESTFFVDAEILGQ